LVTAEAARPGPIAGGAVGTQLLPGEAANVAQSPDVTS
jgi:hypothetical protein